MQSLRTLQASTTTNGRCPGVAYSLQGSPSRPALPLTEDPAMKTVQLARQRRTLGNGRKALYYILKWHEGAKLRSQSLGRVTKSKAEDMRRAKVAELMGAPSSVAMPSRQSMSLGMFLPAYLEARTQAEQRGARHKHYPRLKPTTLVEHDVAVRYLIQHLGEHRGIDTIGEPEAESFLDALAAGRLSKARKGNQTYTLGEQSVRKHTRTLRAVWAWAQHHGMVSTNPFRAFHSRPLPTEPGHHVTLAELDALMMAAPSDGWRCMFALCRLAGLRRDEARTLPWSGRVRDHLGDFRQVGVDWDTKRLHIVSTKNQRYRVLPIVAALESLLLENYGRAADGAGTITGLSPNNLTRTAQKIAKAAGLEPWPKLYQSMRVSRENDWKRDGFAEATYAKWLGHSAAVSRQHYVSPTTEEFAAASGRSA